MKKANSITRWICTLGCIIFSAGIFVSCAEDEITPVFDKTELIDDVTIDSELVDDGNGNDGNSNADGPRGKDHDVIDIDVAL